MVLFKDFLPGTRIMIDYFGKPKSRETGHPGANIDISSDAIKNGSNGNTSGLDSDDIDNTSTNLALESMILRGDSMNNELVQQQQVTVPDSELDGPPVYLLSHFHADHYEGMERGWRPMNPKSKIYCTYITAKLLNVTFQIPLNSILSPQEYLQPFTDQNLRYIFCLIDANHCAGSSIILVRHIKSSRNFINTGDLRYYSSLPEQIRYGFRKIQELEDRLKIQQQNSNIRSIVTVTDANDSDQKQKNNQNFPLIHLAFLDFSWAYEAFNSLPSKQNSIDCLLRLVQRFARQQQQQDYHFFRIFFHSHGLGDEQLLAALLETYPQDQFLFYDIKRWTELNILGTSLSTESDSSDKSKIQLKHQSNSSNKTPLVIHPGNRDKQCFLYSKAHPGLLEKVRFFIVRQHRQSKQIMDDIKELDRIQQQQQQQQQQSNNNSNCQQIGAAQQKGTRGPVFRTAQGNKILNNQTNNNNINKFDKVVQISCSTLWWAVNRSSVRQAVQAQTNFDQQIGGPYTNLKGGKNRNSNHNNQRKTGTQNWYKQQQNINALINTDMQTVTSSSSSSGALGSTGAIIDRFGIYRILWSMHSSLQELQKLCQFLRPKYLKPVCAVICDENPDRNQNQQNVQMNCIRALQRFDGIYGVKVCQQNRGSLYSEGLWRGGRLVRVTKTTVAKQQAISNGNENDNAINKDENMNLMNDKDQNDNQVRAQRMLDVNCDEKKDSEAGHTIVKMDQDDNQRQSKPMNKQPSSSESNSGQLSYDNFDPNQQIQNDNLVNQNLNKTKLSSNRSFNSQSSTSLEMKRLQASLLRDNVQENEDVPNFEIKDGDDDVDDQDDILDIEVIDDGNNINDDDHITNQALIKDSEAPQQNGESQISRQSIQNQQQIQNNRKLLENPGRGNFNGKGILRVSDDELLNEIDILNSQNSADKRRNKNVLFQGNAAAHANRQNNSNSSDNLNLSNVTSISNSASSSEVNKSTEILHPFLGQIKGMHKQDQKEFVSNPTVTNYRGFTAAGANLADAKKRNNNDNITNLKHAGSAAASAGPDHHDDDHLNQYQQLQQLQVASIPRTAQEIEQWRAKKTFIQEEITNINSNLNYNRDTDAAGNQYGPPGPGQQRIRNNKYTRTLWNHMEKQGALKVDEPKQNYNKRSREQGVVNGNIVLSEKKKKKRLKEKLGQVKGNIESESKKPSDDNPNLVQSKCKFNEPNNIIACQNEQDKLSTSKQPFLSNQNTHQGYLKGYFFQQRKKGEKQAKLEDLLLKESDKEQLKGNTKSKQNQNHERHHIDDDLDSQESDILHGVALNYSSKNLNRSISPNGTDRAANSIDIDASLYGIEGSWSRSLEGNNSNGKQQSLRDVNINNFKSKPDSKKDESDGGQNISVQVYLNKNDKSPEPINQPASPECRKNLSADFDLAVVESQLLAESKKENQDKHESDDIIRDNLNNHNLPINNANINSYLPGPSPVSAAARNSQLSVATSDNESVIIVQDHNDQDEQSQPQLVLANTEPESVQEIQPEVISRTNTTSHSGNTNSNDHNQDQAIIVQDRPSLESLNASSNNVSMTNNSSLNQLDKAFVLSCSNTATHESDEQEYEQQIFGEVGVHAPVPDRIDQVNELNQQKRKAEADVNVLDKSEKVRVDTVTDANKNMTSTVSAQIVSCTNSNEATKFAPKGQANDSNALPPTVTAVTDKAQLEPQMFPDASIKLPVKFNSENPISTDFQRFKLGPPHLNTNRHTSEPAPTDISQNKVTVPRINIPNQVPTLRTLPFVDVGSKGQRVTKKKARNNVNTAAVASMTLRLNQVLPTVTVQQNNLINKKRQLPAEILQQKIASGSDRNPITAASNEFENLKAAPVLPPPSEITTTFGTGNALKKQKPNPVSPKATDDIDEQLILNIFDSQNSKKSQQSQKSVLSESDEPQSAKSDSSIRMLKNIQLLPDSSSIEASQKDDEQDAVEKEINEQKIKTKVRQRLNNFKDLDDFNIDSGPESDSENHNVIQEFRKYSYINKPQRTDNRPATRNSNMNDPSSSSSNCDSHAGTADDDGTNTINQNFSTNLSSNLLPIYGKSRSMPWPLIRARKTIKFKSDENPDEGQKCASDSQQTDNNGNATIPDKILITGGTGMIGSQVARAVLEDPDCVFNYDSEVVVLARYRSSLKNLKGILKRDVDNNLNDGSDPGAQQQELNSKIKFRHRGIRIIYGDITDSFDMLRIIVEVEKPTYIFHFAAQAINGVSWAASGLSMQVNTQGTLNVLEAVLRLDRERQSTNSKTQMLDSGKNNLSMNLISKKTKVLVAGSSAEYGFTALDYNGKPIPENVPLKPLTPYGVSKVATENLATAYALNYGIEVVIARIFIHMAPGGTEHLSVQNFAKQIAEIESVYEKEYLNKNYESNQSESESVANINKTTTKDQVTSQTKDIVKNDPRFLLHHGDLSSSRDVTDVRDSRYVYPLLISKGIPGEPYNVGSNKGYSVQSMLDVLLNISFAPITPKLDKSRLRKADEKVLLADISKIKNLTGWVPNPNINTIAEDLLNYWREEIGDRGF